MVVVQGYRPHWPDELELSPGDVILVLSKHEEERWFGRLQGGQRGYFPASCVMELSQVGLVPEWAQQCSIAGPCCCSCVMSEGRLYFLFFSILLFHNSAGFERENSSASWYEQWDLNNGELILHMRFNLLVTRRTTQVVKTFVLMSLWGALSLWHYQGCITNWSCGLLNKRAFRSSN